MGFGAAGSETIVPGVLPGGVRRFIRLNRELFFPKCFFPPASPAESPVWAGNEPVASELLGSNWSRLPRWGSFGSVIVIPVLASDRKAVKNVL